MATMIDAMAHDTAVHAAATTGTMVEALDRQIDRLVSRGYSELVGLSENAFRRRLAPLAASLVDLPLSLLQPTQGDTAPQPGSGPDLEPGYVPFVLVLSGHWVPAHTALGRVELRGKPAFTDLAPDNLARFRPLDGLELPGGEANLRESFEDVADEHGEPDSRRSTWAYLAYGVDTGRDTLNVTPDDALERIRRAGRSPLTVEEGVALVTQFPELLKTANCFSLLGSRCGDRRVPALWVAKGGAPRLGWCWAGNPHTWLGSASCAGRVGAPPV